MFKSRTEALILKKYKRQQLLSMFRNTLTKVSNLRSAKLAFDVSAYFDDDGFSFGVTVFTRQGDNTSLTIYDFWDVEPSQKKLDAFIAAIKTGNFEKIKAAASLG